MSKYPKRVEYFMNYVQQVKSKSKDSAEAYAIDVCLFFKWYIKTNSNLSIKVEDVDMSIVNDELIRNLQAEDVEAFMGYIENERGNALTTKARKIASLKGFFKYIHKKCKLLDENIADDLTTPKIHRKDPEYIKYEDGVKMLNCIANSGDKYAIRNFTMVYLYLSNGLRLSELTKINLDDLDLEGKILKTIGKGNKPATIYLNDDESVDVIKTYLDWRKTFEDKIKPEDKDAVFISSKNCRINKRSVERMIKVYMEAIGLDINKYHVHSIRHGYCMNLYKQGYDLRTIQQLMRHDNITTTTFYFRSEADKLREANNSIKFGVKFPQVSTQ